MSPGIAAPFHSLLCFELLDAHQIPGLPLLSSNTNTCLSAPPFLFDTSHRIGNFHHCTKTRGACSSISTTASTQSLHLPQLPIRESRSRTKSKTRRGITRRRKLAISVRLFDREFITGISIFDAAVSLWAFDLVVCHPFLVQTSNGFFGDTSRIGCLIAPTPCCYAHFRLRVLKRHLQRQRWPPTFYSCQLVESRLHTDPAHKRPIYIRLAHCIDFPAAAHNYGRAFLFYGLSISTRFVFSSTFFCQVSSPSLVRIAETNRRHDDPYTSCAR